MVNIIQEHLRTKIRAHKQSLAVILFLVSMALIVFGQAFAEADIAMAERNHEQLAYSLQVHFNSGTFTLEGLDLIESGAMPSEKGNEYILEVVSFSGKVLYETSFNAKIRIYDTNLEMIEERTIDFVLPYYPNANKIMILQAKKQLLEIDVAGYAQCNENNKCDKEETQKLCPNECSCGNGVCDVQENYLSCSRDCKSGQKDKVCDAITDGLCDPDCKGQTIVDNKEESGKQDSDCTSLLPENMNLESSSNDSFGKTKVILFVLIILTLICCVIFLFKNFRKPITLQQKYSNKRFNNKKNKL